MKIMVVSDTHKNFQALKNAVDKNKDMDLMIHLGDGEHEFGDVRSLNPTIPMIYIGGNVDFGTHRMTHVVDAKGVKIFCTHGHLYNVHDGLDLLVQEAKKNGCKIALYGHTHLYRTEIVNGVFVMNPGSLDSPRNHNKPTYGVIQLSDNGEIKMNIMAMDRR